MRMLAAVIPLASLVACGGVTADESVVGPGLRGDPQASERGGAECGDATDNDGDGAADCDDADCVDAAPCGDADTEIDGDDTGGEPDDGDFTDTGGDTDEQAFGDNPPAGTPVYLGHVAGALVDGRQSVSCTGRFELGVDGDGAARGWGDCSFDGLEVAFGGPMAGAARGEALVVDWDVSGVGDVMLEGNVTAGALSATFEVNLGNGLLFRGRVEGATSAE